MTYPELWRGVLEYTTDRGVTIQVFRGLSGYRMIQLTGEPGERVQMKLLDVPRLVQALQRILADIADKTTSSDRG